MAGLIMPVTPETHRQFREDIAYLNSIWKDVVQEYPDCYVVVHKGEIVAADKELDRAWETVDKRGIPRNVVAHSYVSKEPMRMLL